MPDQVQLRGGSQAENDSFTGAAREVTVDTTNHTLRIHDGTTLGGHKLVSSDTFSSLGGYAEATVEFNDATGTITLDLAISNVFIINPAYAITVEFDNKPTNNSIAAITIIIGNSDHAITWPVGSEHPDGQAPTIEGKTYLSVVIEPDGTPVIGTAWSGIS